jgi:hypothetical protein
MSVHLAKQFQRRFLEIDQSETRIAWLLMDQNELPWLLMDQNEMSNLYSIEDHP